MCPLDGGGWWRTWYGERQSLTNSNADHNDSTHVIWQLLSSLSPSMLALGTGSLLKLSWSAGAGDHRYSYCAKVGCGLSSTIQSQQLPCTRRSVPRRMTTVHADPGRSTQNASATDAAEGGLFQALGNLCFRSKYSDQLWTTSISAPYKIVRVAAMTLISLILLARSWRLFIR